MTGSRCTDVKAWRRAVLAAASLTLSAKVAAFALHESMRWTASDPDAGRCWPGLRTLAEDCGLDRRSLMRSLELLERSGFVDRSCRRGCEVCRGGNGHTTIYTATLPERGHSATAERGDSATASGGASGGNGALSGGNGASQRGDGATGTDLEHERTEELAREPAAAAACTECSGNGWQLDEDDRAAPCPGCKAGRVLPEPLEVRGGQPDGLDHVLSTAAKGPR